MTGTSSISDPVSERWFPFGWFAAAAVLSALALVLWQCAGSGDRSGEFDPLGFPGDDEVVTRHVASANVAADTGSVNPDAAWTVRRAVDTVTVYRVQFYATNNFAEAEDILRRARRTLSDSLAIDYETPYYKLKAGPFPERAAADKLVTKLRAMGYTSAWVVEDRLVHRRKER